MINLGPVIHTRIQESVQNGKRRRGDLGSLNNSGGSFSSSDGWSAEENMQGYIKICTKAILKYHWENILKEDKTERESLYKCLGDFKSV